MTDKELVQLKKKLLRLKIEHQAQEEECKEAAATVELDQSRMGRISRMDAMQTPQMALESFRRHSQQILKVEGALQRIGTGEYGYCFICGEKIILQRLNADPTITRCIDCAE